MNDPIVIVIRKRNNDKQYWQAICHMARVIYTDKADTTWDYHIISFTKAGPEYGEAEHQTTLSAITAPTVTSSIASHVSGTFTSDRSEPVEGL